MTQEKVLIHGGMFTDKAFGLPSTLARVEERVEERRANRTEAGLWSLLTWRLTHGTFVRRSLTSVQTRIVSTPSSLRMLVHDTEIRHTVIAPARLRTFAYASDLIHNRFKGFSDGMPHA